MVQAISHEKLSNQTVLPLSHIPLPQKYLALYQELHTIELYLDA